MRQLLERLHALEQEAGVLTATLSMGFPFADTYDAGVSVLVTTMVISPRLRQRRGRSPTRSGKSVLSFTWTSRR